MGTQTKTRLFIFTAIITLFLIGCANEQAPSGGPPDKEPPKIDSFEPAQMTKNFTEEKITVEFSEYVNKASVVENIFITPRLTFEPSWSGRYLDIIFTEKPQENTTYTISLGGDYTDLKSNKPTESFALTFSTGNVIDSGIVRGKIFDESPAGTYLFLYPLSAVNPDTLNPSKTEPRYVAQAGTSGDFTFYALPDGNYRLMAVRDLYKDRLYNAGTDGYGSPWKDITVQGAKSESIVLRCDEPLDSASPALLNAESISAFSLLLDFGEELDSTVFNPSLYKITDSTGNISNRVIDIYPNPKNFRNIIAITERVLDTNTLWKIVVDSSVKDLKGNKIVDTLRSRFFSGINEKDSIRPDFSGVSIADSSKNVNVSGYLKLLFTLGVDSSKTMEGISLTDILTRKKEVLAFHWKNSTEVRINAENTLQPNKWYEYELKHNYIVGWNGVAMKDSIQKIRFKTVDTREYGSIKGEFYDSLGITGGSYILLISPKNARKGTKPYTITLAKAGTWSMDKIPAGEYYIGAYHDANNNGKYDFGSPFPYTLAERFMPKPVEISVKSRWKIEDIKVAMGR